MAVSPPCFWVQGEDTDSRWAASWPRQPAVPLLTSPSCKQYIRSLFLDSSSLWLFSHFPSFLTNSLTVFFFSFCRYPQLTEKRWPVLPLFSSYSSAHPLLSFEAQGGEQELARLYGWVSCNWNWCKGLRVALVSVLLIAHCSVVMHFPWYRWQKNMTDFQSFAGPWGSHSCL